MAQITHQWVEDSLSMSSDISISVSLDVSDDLSAEDLIGGEGFDLFTELDDPIELEDDAVVSADVDISETWKMIDYADLIGQVVI